MSTDVGAILRELDFSIIQGSSSDAWLLRAPDGTSFEVSPAPSVSRLNAHTIRTLIAHHQGGGSPLLVGETATDGVLGRAEAGQVDILIADPVRLIHAGIPYTVQEGAAPRSTGATPRRHAWMRWAVERFLVLVAEPMRQSVIASALGTSQQSVSNAAGHLAGLVTDCGEGLVATDRARLLEHWRNEYTGPGGQAFGWYSLGPVAEQVSKAVEVAKFLDLSPLVSGDIAADRIAPWKLPVRGRVYVDGPVDLADEGLVPAPLEEATLITCIPRDPTLHRLVDLRPGTAEPEDLPIADPAIVYWDLVHTTDTDSGEAAARLATVMTGGKA